MKRFVVTLLAIAMLVTLSACSVEQKNKYNQADYTKEEAGYWLSKVNDPDEVLLTTDEIAALNKNMDHYWATDWNSGYYDVETFPETVAADELKARIEKVDVKNRGLYCKGQLVTSDQWEEAYKNLNLDALSDSVTVSYGITVNNTAMYDFPTAEIHTGADLNEAENALQQSYLRMNEPVIVILESADTAWYYVVAQEYIGWIESKDCALFENKQAWMDYYKQDNFLMVTEDCKINGIEGDVLMGTKLYLAENSQDICVPKRNEQEEIELTYVSVSSDAKVNEGYLPFTAENVLTLAFKELGEPYGWGGIHGDRDCSLYIMHIYDCFGIELPRNSGMQMKIPEMRAKAEGMSVAEKEAVLAETNPGAILGISGHVMLYLGEDNGQHYVISMLGSYIPEEVSENFGDHIVSAQKCMINTLDVHRKNGNTWLQELIDVSDIEVKE